MIHRGTLEIDDWKLAWSVGSQLDGYASEKLLSLHKMTQSFAVLFPLCSNATSLDRAAVLRIRKCIAESDRALAEWHSDTHSGIHVESPTNDWKSLISLVLRRNQFSSSWFRWETFEWSVGRSVFGKEQQNLAEKETKIESRWLGSKSDEFHECGG